MWKEFFKSKEWEKGFKLGKKKMKDLLEWAKRGQKEGVNLEALEILEFYGLPMAPYRVVKSQDEVYQVAEELGYPLVLKAVTSKVIHKEDAGAVALVSSKEMVARAYPSVLGEVASRMPWLSIMGVLVQQKVEGDKKHEIGLERSKKKAFPFRWITRLLKRDGEEGESRDIEVKDANDLAMHTPQEEEWRDIYQGIWALWLQYPQIRRLELDVICGPASPKVVDAKIFFFQF